jgi:hypothetical protein
MNRARLPAWRVLLPFVGFIGWSIVFVVLYGLQATGCRLGWQDMALFAGVTLQRAALVVLFLVSLGAMGALTWWIFTRWREARSTEAPRPAAFLEHTGFWAGLGALGATAFCFAGVFWLTAC